MALPAASPPYPPGDYDCTTLVTANTYRAQLATSRYL